MIANALVLTAGLGTRLRPLTRVRAKPAMPVGGEALVRRIIGWLAAGGVTDLVLNLHHLPETVTAEVGDGADLGARVRYSWEQPVVLGSAGGPRHALDIVGAGTFFLVNGDTLTDVDPAALAAEHARSGALVTLALVPNTAPGHYGGVRLDAGGRVTGFVPRGPGAAGSCHFIGVQVVNAEVFADLPPGTPASSIGGVYDELVAKRPGAVRGVLTGAAFWDVGTAADYWATSAAFAPGDGNQIGRRCRIDPSARVTRSILWDDVEVGADCRLDECIVTDRVRVGDGRRHHREILFDADGRLATAPLML